MEKYHSPKVYKIFGVVIIIFSLIETWRTFGFLLIYKKFDKIALMLNFTNSINWIFYLGETLIPLLLGIGYLVIAYKNRINKNTDRSIRLTFISLLIILGVYLIDFIDKNLPNINIISGGLREAIGFWLGLSLLVKVLLIISLIFLLIGFFKKK